MGGGWRGGVPFELLVEAADQQLMLLCISALLVSRAGQLALQLLQLVLQKKTGDGAGGVLRS